MTTFNINQLVMAKGNSVFVIIGFRIIDNEECAQLKCVNPDNYAETSPGEFALPVSTLRPIY